jgi:hypothetical protein
MASRRLGSKRQVLLADPVVAPERSGGALVADVPLLEHVHAVGEVEAELDVLLGEEDGQPVVLEPGDLLAQVVDDQRRQALGRLVEQQESGLPSACGRS